MCHAILGSTFRNRTTSKLRPLTTVPRVVVFVRFYCSFVPYLITYKGNQSIASVYELYVHKYILVLYAVHTINTEVIRIGKDKGYFTCTLLNWLNRHRYRHTEG